MNKENLILKNYSAVPNYFIDNIVSSISAFECVVMLCILRKTIGFQKLEDKIALSQIVKLSGLSKSTCVNCLKTLEEKKFIFIQRITIQNTKQSNVIKINIKKLFGSTADGLGWSGSSNFYSPFDGHTKESLQNKRDLSFKKKEEYPEIPIIQCLNNEKRIDFDIIEIEAQS